MTTDPHAVGERIEQLLEASSAGGPTQRERAEELVRLVVDLYGAGLERLLEIAYERGALTDDVLRDLVDDELVSSLLLVHGLHPLPVQDRVERALAALGTDAQLVEITDEGVARVQAAGGGHGCSSSSVTTLQALEMAVLAAAPELVSVEQVETPRAPSVIPIEALGIRLRDAGVVA